MVKLPRCEVTEGFLFASIPSRSPSSREKGSLIMRVGTWRDGSSSRHNQPMPDRTSIRHLRDWIDVATNSHRISNP